MVDIHSHILPQIDDGAESIEESLAMLRRAIRSGVDTIVATPHLYPGLYVAPTSYRNEMLSKIRNAVEEKQMPIEIISGRECFLEPELYEHESELANLTIGDNGKYILIETSMLGIPKFFDRMIFEIQAHGITPILAHAERYADMIKDPNLTLKYIEMGCLIQMNIGSLAGRYGHHVKKTALILLENQMVHIVAGDMHNPGSLALGEGFMILSELMGQEKAQQLVDLHPRAVVENRIITIPEPSIYRQKPKPKNLWGLLN